MKIKFFQVSADCFPNPNFVQTNGMINYWPLCSSLTDIITNLSLYNLNNVAFASDRFNVANGAMSFSTGYLQAPSGIYFSGGDYTIMAWIYPRAFLANERLIDFGNGGPGDNIITSISSGTSGQVYQSLLVGIQNPFTLTSPQPLQLNQWNHVAFTFSNSTMNACLYLNGTLVAIVTSAAVPNNVLRTQNFIGKSNWAVDANANANAIFDEIKIFSVALTQFQVQTEMANEYYGNFSTSTTSWYFLYENSRPIFLIVLELKLKLKLKHC
jgi:hypothetical protein